MQRRTLVFVALLAVVAVATLAGVDGALKRPKDMADRVTEACNSTCVKSCNSTFNAFNNWFKDLSDSDSDKCDACAVVYYAQDFNVDIGKCPCKTLEQFRKVAMDTNIADEEECAECCLDWTLDVISYEEDCKDPDEMKPKKSKSDEEKGSYRNACGFTIKVMAEEEKEKEEKKKEEDKEEKKEEKKDDDDDKEEKEEKKKEEDEEEDKEVSVDGVYEYESLGSQFDTCKCICKGLDPCKPPKDAEEEEESSGQTASSFFDSATFSAPEAEQESDDVSMDDALSAILP